MVNSRAKTRSYSGENPTQLFVPAKRGKAGNPGEGKEDEDPYIPRKKVQVGDEHENLITFLGRVSTFGPR